MLKQDRTLILPVSTMILQANIFFPHTSDLKLPKIKLPFLGATEAEVEQLNAGFRNQHKL